MVGSTPRILATWCLRPTWTSRVRPAAPGTKPGSRPIAGRSRIGVAAGLDARSIRGRPGGRLQHRPGMLARCRSAQRAGRTRLCRRPRRLRNAGGIADRVRGEHGSRARGRAWRFATRETGRPGANRARGACRADRATRRERTELRSRGAPRVRHPRPARSRLRARWRAAPPRLPRSLGSDRARWPGSGSLWTLTCSTRW